MRVVAADAGQLTLRSRRVGFPLQRVIIAQPVTGHDMFSGRLFLMTGTAEFSDRLQEQ
jgi:hypothetical protein